MIIVNANEEQMKLKFAMNFKSALVNVNEDIKIPRIVSQQQGTSQSIQDSDFVTTIMIPVVEGFIDQLRTRFENNKSTIISLLYTLIPTVCCKNETNCVDDYLHFMKKFWGETEFDLWRSKFC